MFDDTRFNEWLDAYKRNFDQKHWQDERYKWEAVKVFQDNFDINAPNLRAMLEASLAKCGNLLTTQNRFPAGMLFGFAESNPSKVRSMLVDLFDESKDLWERIEAFKSEADKWRETTKAHNESLGKGYNHYQDENSITTYLWLRYPTRHYIYKYGIARVLWQQFCTDRPIKKGAYATNVRNNESMYDDICERLTADPDLRDTLDAYLDDGCDRDEALHTLTIDFGYYVWDNMRHGIDPSQKDGDCWPSKEEYDPGITTERWVELLGDASIFDTAGMQIMRRFLDSGGSATCKQLSDTYGETNQFYNGGSQRLARNVQKATGCPVMPHGEEGRRWWPILFVGKDANAGRVGSYEWRLRDELREALGQIDLSAVPLYADERTELPDAQTQEEQDPIDPYEKADFLREVYMSEERYMRLRGVLLNKQNLILQGAPGVGKTFCARRLAWSIMGKQDDSRIEMVQFHQSYTYEDFVMGYKPDGEGFSLKEGVFYRFCKRAAADAGHKYFFIIDEINRSNLSKVLGELMMLIERDYRGIELTLAYRDEPFCVPKNLYIIGMMNTADRSLALIDYALRRRFAFFQMVPGYDSERFQEYQASLGSELFGSLVDQIKALNAEIRRDPSLGKGFEIGHSHLCGREHEGVDDEWLSEVVEYDIIPTLEEYWFDDQEKADRWTAALRGALQ